MRKFLPVFTVVLLLSGIFWIWRATHPPLSDEQQIAAHLNSICEAAQARNSRGITDFLSKNFQSNGVGKKEVQTSLVGGILQYRVIDLKVNRVENIVRGESARSTGNFTLSLQSERESPPQFSAGKFDLTWRKIEGEWKIIGAQGDFPAEISGR